MKSTSYHPGFTTSTKSDLRPLLTGDEKKTKMTKNRNFRRSFRYSRSLQHMKTKIFFVFYPFFSSSRHDDEESANSSSRHDDEESRLRRIIMSHQCSIITPYRLTYGGRGIDHCKDTISYTCHLPRLN